MPVGELGGLWQKQYQISAKNVDAELIRSNKRPSEPYEESFDDLVLQGTISNLYECGRIVFLNQKRQCTQPHCPFIGAFDFLRRRP